MTVKNGSGNPRKEQAERLLRQKAKEEELEAALRENATLRAQLQLPQRERKGRKPTREGTQSAAMRSMMSLARKVKLNKASKEFIRQAAEDGVSAMELRAMCALGHEAAWEAMFSGDMEARFALATAHKYIETMIKLREVEAMEAAEVAGHITINVAGWEGLDEPPLIDVTPEGGE